MKRIAFFAFLSIFFLVGIFFNGGVVDALHLSIFLNSPAPYNSATGVQTVCMPQGYLPVAGRLGMYVCENTPPSLETVYVSLVPQGGSGGIILGSIPVVALAGQEVGFSDFFTIGNSCTLSGPGTVTQNGTANFTVSYKGLSGTPIFASGYPNCGAGGTIISSSCNSSSCIFSCRYGTSGSVPVSAKVNLGARSAICSTQITVTSAGATCGLTGPTNVLQSTGTATFTLVTSIGGTLNFTENPICGGDGAVLSASCSGIGCTFTCGNYGTVGTFTASTRISNGTYITGCSSQITVDSSGSSCTLVGPGNVTQTQGTANFSLSYIGMGGVPSFTSGYPICGTGGTLTSSNCDGSGCTFACSNYTVSGSFTAAAKIENGTIFAGCSTQIVVQPWAQSSLPLGLYDVVVSSSETFCRKGGSCWPETVFAQNTILLSDCLCPADYVYSDGICIKATKVQSPVYSPDNNCSADSAIQDGICVSSTVMPPIITDTSECSTSEGAVISDGVCLTGSKTTNITNQNCPTGDGSVSSDGVCLSSSKTTNITNPNCPTGDGSVSSDGVCLTSSKISTIITGDCPIDSGYVGFDGICVKADTAYCGDNIKNRSEECDGDDKESCWAACYPAGQDNQCTCLPKNSAPTAGDWQRDDNYCDNGEGAGSIYLGWKYTDPDNDNESRFQFQVDDSPDFDSLEINRDIYDLSNPNGTVNSQALTVSSDPSGEQLAFGTTYYWRVNVYDDQGLESGWIDGPPFTTDDHSWPSPSFTFSPTIPITNHVVAYADESKCYRNDDTSYPCKTLTSQTCTAKDADNNYNCYKWNFGDGSNNVYTIGNVLHTYTSKGAYLTRVRVCDNLGCCSFPPAPVETNIPVKSPISVPEWKEISPF